MKKDLSDKAELIRKRYLYRERIIKGRLKLPYQIARTLVGPDTAYHLYRFRKNR